MTDSQSTFVPLLGTAALLALVLTCDEPGRIEARPLAAARVAQSPSPLLHSEIAAGRSLPAAEPTPSIELAMPALPTLICPDDPHCTEQLAPQATGAVAQIAVRDAGPIEEDRVAKLDPEPAAPGGITLVGPSREDTGPVEPEAGEGIEDIAEDLEELVGPDAPLATDP